MCSGLLIHTRHSKIHPHQLQQFPPPVPVLARFDVTVASIIISWYHSKSSLARKANIVLVLYGLHDLVDGVWMRLTKALDALISPKGSDNGHATEIGNISFQISERH